MSELRHVNAVERLEAEIKALRRQLEASQEERNEGLLALHRKIANAAGCTVEHVSVVFGGIGCEEPSSPAWTCVVAGKWHKTPKKRRPTLQGEGSTPEAAAADVMTKIEEFKNPERSKKIRQAKDLLQTIHDMDIGQDKYDAMKVKLEAELGVSLD